MGISRKEVANLKTMTKTQLEDYRAKEIANFQKNRDRRYPDGISNALTYINQIDKELARRYR